MTTIIWWFNQDFIIVKGSYIVFYLQNQTKIESINWSSQSEQNSFFHAVWNPIGMSAMHGR